MSSALAAQIPKLISYQGLLTTSSGQVLTDGNYNITVKIFDAATGGGELWSEDHTVSTTNGLFSLALGSNTALDLAFDQAYFVSTTINGAELLPRSALTASPYAFKAISTEAPKLRSINISPGMISDDHLLFGASRGNIGNFRYPCIDLAEGAFQAFTFHVPLPSDYANQELTLRILYTSTTTSGDFKCDIAMRGTAIGGDLSRAPGGAKLLPAPAIANDLVEETLTFSAGTNVFDLDSRITSVLFSRFPDDAEDTSSGNLRIVGMVLEYLEN
ncbi:MAG: hypothetical protein Sapg2KO_51410 [Saprospiraceae bacterium]